MRHPFFATLLLLIVTACSSTPQPGSSDVQTSETHVLDTTTRVDTDAAAPIDAKTPPDSQPLADLDATALNDAGNHAPTIVPPAARSVLVGGTLTLSVVATDADGDPLTYAWSSSAGVLSGSGASVSLKAPDQAGTVTVSVSVTDPSGASAQTTISVSVGPPTSFSTALPLTDGTTNSKTPSIAFVGGVGHLVWVTFGSDGPPATLHHVIRHGSSWQASPLPTSTSHRTTPQLFVDGTTLHLFFTQYAGTTPETYHAVWSGDAWSPAQRIGTGWRASAAVDGDGGLHVVLFNDSTPQHYRLSNGSWTSGDPITVPNPYINALRLKLLGGTPLTLALSTSPGNNVGYRIRLFTWTAGAGWKGGSDAQLLNPGGLTSDDMDGTRDANGLAVWTWTEQTPENEWTFGVATRRSGQSTSWAGKTEGSNFVPTIVVPADNRAFVAWISESSGVQLAREPFGSVVTLGGSDPYGPSLAVDSDGFTHLVYYARDAKGVQQIYHCHNIP